MGEPIRLLIIEDSEDDAYLLVRELRIGGFNFTFYARIPPLRQRVRSGDQPGI